MKCYAQHQRRLYVYLLSLVHNAADAEELMQETSYILWKKYDEFKPGSNFGAWACRVAYLETLKFREGRGRNALPLSPKFLERVAGKMDEVSDELEWQSETFQHCIERLSPADRELICLRYAPGTSVKQIAADLDRPVRSVSKSLSRIRKALLDCMELQRRREEQP